MSDKIIVCKHKPQDITPLLVVPTKSSIPHFSQLLEFFLYYAPNISSAHAKDFDEKADGIVVDCSFISLEYILPPLPSLLNESGYILALIKPQFETGGKTHMKHGVLRDDKERYRVLKKIYSTIIDCGLKFRGLCLATNDDKKNKEYIAYISKSGESVDFDEAFSSTS